MIITFCILATFILFITAHYIDLPNAGERSLLKILFTVVGILGVCCFCWCVKNSIILP